MEQATAILGHWFDAGKPVVRPVPAAHGFSGARLWQVEHAERLFALREWPASGVDDGRLAWIHDYQNRLARRDLPVPAPMRTLLGGTFVNAYGRLWELATWMPGSADYWQNPQLEKLRAALKTLAQIHGASDAGPEKCDSLESRLRKLHELVVRRDFDHVRRRFAKLAGDERRQAEEALRLMATLVPRELEKTRRWHGVKLPTTICLRDIWHDHVLFTGDVVTGIVDFGAAEEFAPAADIARLLGSMVGDDWERWAEGVAAYETVRPLTDHERKAVRFFDATGVVLSAANWLDWLYGASAERLAGTFDREAALGRFYILVRRLRTLADC